jgi:hypothetical protein
MYFGLGVPKLNLRIRFQIGDLFSALASDQMFELKKIKAHMVDFSI